MATTSRDSISPSIFIHTTLKIQIENEKYSNLGARFRSAVYSIFWKTLTMALPKMSSNVDWFESSNISPQTSDVY